MPKYFHCHSLNNDWDWQLEKCRCTSHNKNGDQCKRLVIIGLPFCFQHTASVYYQTTQLIPCSHVYYDYFCMTIIV